MFDMWTTAIPGVDALVIDGKVERLSIAEDLTCSPKFLTALITRLGWSWK